MEITKEILMYFFLKNIITWDDLSITNDNLKIYFDITNPLEISLTTMEKNNENGKI